MRQNLIHFSVFVILLIAMSACNKDDEGSNLKTPVSAPIASIVSQGAGYPSYTNVFHRNAENVLDSISNEDETYIMEYTGSNITTIRRRDGSKEVDLTYTDQGQLKQTGTGDEGIYKQIRFYTRGKLSKLESHKRQLQPDGSRAYELNTALDNIDVSPLGGTMKYKSYYQSQVISTYLCEVECINNTNNLYRNIPYVVLPIFSDYFFSITNQFPYLITSLNFVNTEDSSDTINIEVEYTFTDDGKIKTVKRSSRGIPISEVVINYIE